MNTVTDQEDMAARRHCVPLLRDLGLKSLNDLRPHEMTWAELNQAEKRIKTTAGNLIDKIDGADAETCERVEQAHDGLMSVFDDLKREKDIRGDIGNREPRAQAESPAQLARRPGYEPVTVRTDGGEGEAETAFALAPEQRFATWARAKSGGEEYRGLGLGQYIRSMIIGGKTDIERRALSEGSDSAGGYTVPDILSAALIDLARAQSVVMRAGAQTVPLTSDTNVIAKLLTDPVPAWRSEAGAVAESDPTFGLVTMTPRSLAVQTLVSIELMEDSLNLATELPRVLAAAMAVELDRVALLGSGTPPEPEGILNVSGIGTTALAAALAGFGPLVTARTGILTANLNPTAIIMHPRDEGTLAGLVDSTGQPLQAPRVIEAIPMLTTTAIPTDGGTGTDESTIFMGDFTKLLVGIRSDIRVEVLKTSTYASNLQYTLLAHMRADVAVTQAGGFYTITAVTG